MESLRVMASTFSMVRLSPMPQYCAVSTDAPEVSPKNRVSTNCTCPASEAPESTTSPTRPSMMTSALCTPTLIRFCRAMGTTSPSTWR